MSLRDDVLWTWRHVVWSIDDGHLGDDVLRWSRWGERIGYVLGRVLRPWR